MSAYYTVRSVAKAVAILRAFSRDRSELGVSELSRMLGINKTVVQKLVLYLKQEGLLRQNPATRKYCLGPRIIEIASTFLKSDPLTREGAQCVSELVRRTNMSAALGILVGTEVLCVLGVEADALVKASSRTGDRRPAHATAVGKCIMAFMPEPERTQIIERLSFQRLTPNTITDPESFRMELARVAQQGYALNQEESAVGLCGVAAPVLDRQRTAMAAISVAIPKGSLAEADLHEIIRLAVHAGEVLAGRLEGLPMMVVARA